MVHVTKKTSTLKVNSLKQENGLLYWKLIVSLTFFQVQVSSPCILFNDPANKFKT